MKLNPQLAGGLGREGSKPTQVDPPPSQLTERGSKPPPAYCPAFPTILLTLAISMSSILLSIKVTVLDSLVSDRPAIFHRRCLHVMALNSRAIGALRLDSADFVPPENIEIVRFEILV